MIPVLPTKARIGPALFAALALLSCVRPAKEVRRVELMMGTEVDLLAQGKSEPELQQAVSRAFAEFERLEQKLSLYQADSAISRIAAQAGIAPVAVDDEVFMLVEKSLEVCRESEGAFDLTVLPLVALWRVEDQEARPPAEAEVKEKLELVGCEKIVLNPEAKTVFLPEPGMGIDLGGIAKGYAADCAVKILRDNGAAAGIVKAGGDLRVFGGEGKGMAVGLRNPREAGKILAKVYLKDGALSTSGDYERFYIFNGKRYSHIIDPRTGAPASGEASVSVKAASGIESDAWSTALFVLGHEAGMKLLQTRPGLEAFFLEPSGESHSSKWFADNLIAVSGD